LSPAADRRLDELLDEWAWWFTRRNGDAPMLEVSGWHAHALDTSRSWESTFEIESERVVKLVPQVNDAIDNLAEQHRRVLHTWAHFEHSPLSVMRRIEREVGVAVVRSNRAMLTDANLMAAKLALVPRLADEGVYLPD
jgi:hypothetical protein